MNRCDPGRKKDYSGPATLPLLSQLHESNATCTTRGIFRNSQVFSEWIWDLHNFLLGGMRSYSGWYVHCPSAALLIGISFLLPIKAPRLTKYYSLTCKRRKLKCDESKPICRKCTKASRDCSYGEQSIFRSQIGSTPDRIRKRVSNHQDKQADSPRNETTWVELPSECRFQSGRHGVCIYS